MCHGLVQGTEPDLQRSDVRAMYRALSEQADMRCTSRDERQIINSACGIRRVVSNDADKPGYATDAGAELGRLHNRYGVGPDGSFFSVHSAGARPTRRDWHPCDKALQRRAQEQAARERKAA